MKAQKRDWDTCSCTPVFYCLNCKTKYSNNPLKKISTLEKFKDVSKFVLGIFVFVIAVVLLLVVTGTIIKKETKQEKSLDYPRMSLKTSPFFSEQKR